MTNFTIWEVNKRITDLQEFLDKYKDYLEHSAGSTRQRHLGTFPTDDIDSSARSKLNFMRPRIKKYILDTDNYPLINYRDPLAIGGRAMQIDIFENLFNLNAFEIPHTTVSDTLERTIGYYQDQRPKAVLRTINPLWWIWRLVSVVIAFPFYVIGWAGYDRDQIESKPAAKLFKAVTWFVAIVTFMDSMVQLLINLGLDALVSQIQGLIP